MKRKKIIIWAVSVTLVLTLAVGGCAIYLFDFYRADNEAIAAFSDRIEVKREEHDGFITYGDGDEKTGFIFYPGGKVEYTAYEPLMLSLARSDVFCVLVEMPHNLAVLDINAAEDIRVLYSDIRDWYIGGHSLGGSMAASHVSENIDKYRGLVLLGAYSTVDLSESGLTVLSLYGSEDKVMNREKYEKYRENLPKSFYDVEIPGANHAYFGMYGEQSGDGEATMSREQQINSTANAIYEVILRGRKDAEGN